MSTAESKKYPPETFEAVVKKGVVALTGNEGPVKKIFIISYNIYAYLHRPDLRVAGGAELQIATLAKHLSARGYQVIFYTGDFEQAQEVELGGYLFIKGESNQAGKLQKFVRFASYLKKLKPDVILERGTSPFSFLAATLGKLLRVPYVFCAASDVNFAYKEMDPSFCGNRLKQRIFHWSLRFVTHFVVQKKKQAELLKENFGIDSNVTLIRNFPPELDWEKINRQRPVSPLYDAAWIANLIPYKQPELFIELARRFPARKFLLIGGSSDKDYHQQLLQRIGTVPNLTAVGYVPHKDVIDWMQQCRIIVNTTNVASGYEEGFSNVQLMGWICGKPTLTLISDPDRLITTNKMGFCSGSFEQLCADFKTLAENTQLYAEMSQNAIRYVNDNHATQQVLEGYLQLFHRSSKQTGRRLVSAE